MSFNSLILKKEGSIATITMHRPEKLNALNKELALELSEAIEQCSIHDEVKVLILKGSGRAFCAGGDIEEMMNHIIHQNNPPGFFREPLKAIHEASIKILKIPKPVIASIKGYAAGAGFNLALCCDFRIAAAGTKMNQAFINIGLVPDTGGSFLLPRMIGLARALELFSTGDFINAEQAFEIGLINKVVAEEALDNEVLTFAKKLASKPPLAIGKIKELIFRTYGRHIEHQFELERLLQVELSSSYDFREGIKAFIEKRMPQFKGY